MSESPVHGSVSASPSPRSRPTPSTSNFPPSKRKRDDDHPASVKKPAKKRKKAKARNLEDDKILDLQLGISTAIGRMDKSLLADYVAQQTKRFAADLSLVELEDQRIPGNALLETSGWEKPRTLDQLPDFLDRYGPRAGQKDHKLGSASKTLGSPHTLVVTSSGLRAADLTRTLRTFQTKDATVAKLFAKHIKLREAIAYVKQTRMGIGVGTPSRIVELLESGALSSLVLKRVVVDCSHIDQKRRSIFDMRETQKPLMQLLNRPELKDRYGNGQGDVQLIFY